MHEIQSASDNNSQQIEVGDVALIHAEEPRITEKKKWMVMDYSNLPSFKQVQKTQDIDHKSTSTQSDSQHRGHNVTKPPIT